MVKGKKRYTKLYLVYFNHHRFHAYDEHMEIKRQICGESRTLPLMIVNECDIFSPRADNGSL